MKRIVRWVLYFHGVVLLALVLTHCSFTHFAKRSYEDAKKEKPFDVVIVPGVPYRPGSVSRVMKMRVLWARHLYDSGYTRNIIFSGSSVYSPYVEGIVMKVMADSLGIPPGNTFSETRAEHSTENVYYSWKLARQMGFEKIALATDPYQAGLLRSFIGKYCKGMKSIPVVFGTIDLDGQTLPEIDPQGAFVSDFVPITERESFWERFRGTRGKRVKDEVAAEEALRKRK